MCAPAMAARCAHSAVLPGYAARHASADCVGHTVDQPTPGLLSSNAAPAVLLSRAEQCSYPRALTPRACSQFPELASSGSSGGEVRSGGGRGRGGRADHAPASSPRSNGSGMGMGQPGASQMPSSPAAAAMYAAGYGGQVRGGMSNEVLPARGISSVLQQMTGMQAASVPTLHAADLGCRCPPSCCCADGSTADDGHAGGVCWIRPGGHDAGGSHDGSHAR